MKVLVVEDPVNRHESLATGLRKLGYSVDTVQDSAQAIAGPGNQNYELIILDLVPSRESSLLVLHEIREHDRNVDILLLSERDQIHDRVTALIQGASDYLVKPCSIEDIHARIQALQKNRIGSGSDDAAAKENTEQLNRIIESLLGMCRCETGAIELVISEVKLSELLDRVKSELHDRAALKNMRILLPGGKLPILLADAKCIQRLLVVLASISVALGPDNAEIEFDVQKGQEFCRIRIDSSLSRPLSSDALKKMFSEYHGRDSDPDYGQTMTSLSLARRYADGMNLELHACLTGRNRVRLEVSNIKMI